MERVFETLVIPNDPHERRKEHARASFETSQIHGGRAATSRAVFMLSGVDSDGLGESVSYARDENENHDEFLLRVSESEKDPVEEQNHDKTWPNVSGNDPLQTMRSILRSIERVEHQHEGREALSEGLDEYEKSDQGKEVSPDQMENGMPTRDVGSNEQRNRVRRKVLELSGVVDFEPGRLAGGDISVLVDRTEASAQQSSRERHGHHHGEFDEIISPKVHVMKQIGFINGRDTDERSENGAHDDEKNEIERLLPILGVLSSSDSGLSGVLQISWTATRFLLFEHIFIFRPNHSQPDRD